MNSHFAHRPLDKLPAICATVLALAALTTAPGPLRAEASKAPPAAHAAVDSSPGQALADTFWQGFRDATRRRDFTTLAGMTQLPLKVRGEMDGDPVRRVKAAQLSQALTGLLDQPVYSTQGSATVKRTLRDVVVALERLPASAWLTPTSFRVEQLEFQLVKGRWKLVQGYVSE